MFKILIADDETIARKSVSLLLSSREDISGISEAKNGELAINLLLEQDFDIVLLDIHMPKINGIEVARALVEKKRHTHIIFVTAYNQHAVEAFELNALDYLLKPFDDQRFHKAINKATSKLQSSEVSRHFEHMNTALLKLLSDKENKNNRITLRETGKIKLLDNNDIQYIKGAGNYVEIVLMDGKVLLQRETLKSIQDKLPPERFSRIHKSTIVRNDLITELSPTPKGDYWLSLSTGEKLLMSRRNRNLLETWI